MSMSGGTVKVWAVATALLLTTASCDRGTPEERAHRAAAALLEASRTRDFETVHDLLSPSWREWTTKTDMQWIACRIPTLPEEVAAAVDPEDDEEDRFLAACRAWLERLPPRPLSESGWLRGAPVWLLPPDLLAGISAGGAAVEPDELLLYSEEGEDGRKVPGLTVELRVDRREFGGLWLNGLELSFREVDGDWLFEESCLSVRTAAAKSPDLYLAESRAGTELSNGGTIVNVLADGRVEVMEEELSPSELTDLLKDPAGGPPVVGIDERVPWRRAAEVLDGAAVAGEIRLGACRPRDDPDEDHPERPELPARGERRPGRGTLLFSTPRGT
jgi:hypothetical protein